MLIIKYTTALMALNIARDIKVAGRAIFFIAAQTEKSRTGSLLSFLYYKT